MRRVNRHQLAEKLAERLAITRPMANKIIAEFIECFREEVLEGKPIYLRRLGKFEVKLRRAKIAFDMFNREPIEIPAHFKLVFKAEAGLRREVMQIPIKNVLAAPKPPEQ